MALPTAFRDRLAPAAAGIALHRLPVGSAFLMRAPLHRRGHRGPRGAHADARVRRALHVAPAPARACDRRRGAGGSRRARRLRRRRNACRSAQRCRRSQASHSTSCRGTILRLHTILMIHLCYITVDML